MKGYVSVNSIISTVRRNGGVFASEVSKHDMYSWIGEAMGMITTGAATNHLQEAVCFVEVENHKAPIPKFCNFLVQIARNCHYEKHKYYQSCSGGKAHITGIVDAEDVTTSTDPYKDLLCPARVMPDEIVQQAIVEVDVVEMSKDACCPVPLDCNGCPTSEYGVAFYRPFMDYVYDHHMWHNHSYYDAWYQPVSLATNNFFFELVCSNDKGKDYYHESRNKVYLNNEYGCPEYKVDKENQQLIFSFAKGSVAISYLKTVLDEKGLPKIPDNHFVRDMVASYVLLQLTLREVYNNVEGALSKYDRLDRKLTFKMRRARAQMSKLQGLADLDNFAKVKDYFLPRKRMYDNAFGNLNQIDNRRFVN